MEASTRTKTVKVALPNGTYLHIETTPLGGEQDVAARGPTFGELIDSIEGIATAVGAVLRKIGPRKATVEMGLAVALESGALTAMLVKGSGTANLKITLEYGEKE